MKRILPITLLILSASVYASGQCSEADKQKLMAFDKAWGEAGQRGDAAWFERNFADDFYSISTMTGKLNSKAEEVAEFKNRKDVIASAVASDMDVRVEGSTGIVTGVYRLTGRDEKGQPMDRRIRYTDVYVKRDGRWLVIASQGTLIK